MIGNTQREDGTTQVTYNGWPLYYYAKDQAPGDTTGHDIEDFGAEWYLLTPEGRKGGGLIEARRARFGAYALLLGSADPGAFLYKGAALIGALGKESPGPLAQGVN